MTMGNDAGQDNTTDLKGSFGGIWMVQSDVILVSGCFIQWVPAHYGLVCHERDDILVKLRCKRQPYIMDTALRHPIVGTLVQQLGL